VAVALTALPPVMVLLAAWRWHAHWLSWAAVPTGLATGATLTAYLGTRAATRLEREQVRILKVLADAAH
jgi:uncharacterized membrane protein YfcA